MIYKRFEDIPVWQESRKFVNNVYNILGRNDKLRKDFSLVDQFKRASYSLLLNIS